MKNFQPIFVGIGIPLLSALAACSQATPDIAANASDAAASATPMRSENGETAQQKVAGAEGEPVPTDPDAPPKTGAPTTTTALLLAYSYTATLSLPSDKVVPNMKAHEQKCITAGPALCQVVAAASRKEDDIVTANLSIRATPAWLGTFRNGLEQDAKSFDGKIAAQGVTSEDLTRDITDTDARLRALKALRTRIEALIASRPGKLSDLLEAERELARVQGEIDSFESNLSVMRARVTMSTMDLTYQSRQVAVGGGTFSPLADAFTDFFAVMARSLAALITFLAAILPFALVIGPAVFYGLKWRARRREAKLAALHSKAP
jgi:Domain of unknown function (DUF4349)